MRGLVIIPEFEGNETSLNTSMGINPNKLRQYLLYWDKIDFPKNNMIYIESSPEVKYLENANILQRTEYKGTNNGLIKMNANFYLDMQIYAFNKNNNNKNGEIWSIAQCGKNIELPLENSIKAKTLQVELYNSIPVPNSEVSLEDILDFKEHRYDELQEFRIIMDEMYLSIINSTDKDFTKNMAIEKFQNKLIDLDKIMNESKIERIKNNIKVSLDISGLITSGITVFEGYKYGNMVGKPITGALLGLITPSILKISYECTLKPKKIPTNLKDYAYLYYQNKELK